MAEHAASPAPAPSEPAPVPQADVLDEFGEKLRAFNALRKNDKGAAETILLQLGGNGPVERDIVRDLSLPRPIYIPDRFEEAHRLAMKSLEVLKRNGSRSVRIEEGIGPLRAVAAFVVQFFMRLMVQRYIASAIGGLDDLYTRRSTWTAKGSVEADMLQRARLQVARVAPAYKGKKAGLPSFLLGGAALSSVLSAVQSAADSIRANWILIIATTLAFLLLLLGSAWCALRAAAVARNRIHLTTDKPLNALYETVGAAGNPPSDSSFQFALFALLAMAIAWIVIPVGLYFLFQ